MQVVVLLDYRKNHGIGWQLVDGNKEDVLWEKCIGKKGFTMSHKKEQ